MTISDIVIIVIIACVAITGFIKGLKKSVSSFFKFSVAAVAAFLLTKLLANMLLDVGFIGKSVVGGNSLFGFLRILLPEQLDSISTASIKAQVDGVATVEAIDNIKTLFEQNGVDGFFMTFGFSLFSHALVNQAYLDSSLPTATDIVAIELSYALFCVIVFLVLFLIIRLILALMSRFIKTKGEGKKKKFLLRIGAFLIGASKGFCYTMLILCLVSLINIFSFMNVVNENVEKSMIAQPLLNTAVMLTSNTIESSQTDSRYQKLVDIAGYNIESPA